MHDTCSVNADTPLDEIESIVAGSDSLLIDCGVMAMGNEKLQRIMQGAVSFGVKNFILISVCGQTLIGTGMKGDISLEIHGLMGNHSAAFIDGITIDTYSTTFPNGVWCPGDAQVAIANTSNPKEVNIGGSVDDLFASYSPSGIFRVAGQGGNRCGLRMGAGVPHAWREIDYTEIDSFESKEEMVEDLLYKYQLRKAALSSRGWEHFILDFKEKVEDREPPVIVFGRRVRDYFMEYAQGSIGVVLNIFDIPQSAGFYICSGMTAGKAYIRGDISDDLLGERVRFGRLDEDDFRFLKKTTADFCHAFGSRMEGEYKIKLGEYAERFSSKTDEMVDEFKKIVPAS